MRQRIRSFTAAGAVAVLLATLSVYAPVLNAKAEPPRALFLLLPADRPEPTLSLSASPDSGGTWLLEIETIGFRFTALCQVAAQAAPVGHAHVILDDAKIATAYLPVLSLGPFPEGRHEIRVVLYGQDHRALVGRAGLIAAELEVTVSGQGSG